MIVVEEPLKAIGILNNRGARNGKNVIIWKNSQLKIKCKANQIKSTANHDLAKDDE